MRTIKLTLSSIYYKALHLHGIHIDIGRDYQKDLEPEAMEESSGNQENLTEPSTDNKDRMEEDGTSQNLLLCSA